MKNINLEEKYPSVEGRRKTLKNIVVTTALGAALLAIPVECTKYGGQRTRKDICKIEQGETKEDSLVSGNGDMAAVCDGTYVYHGHHYFE